MFSTVSFLSQIAERQFRLPNDILVEPGKEHLWDTAVKYLYKNARFDLLHLDHIPTGSILLENGTGILLHSSCAYYTELNDFADLADLQRSVYSARLRQNIRTAYNQARREGVRLNVKVTECQADAIEVVRTLSAQKLIGEGFADGGYLSTLLGDFAANALVSQVTVDEQPVAYAFAIVEGKSSFVLDVYFDRNFKRFQLGALLRTALIARCHQAGIQSVGLGMWSPAHESKFANKALLGHKLLRAGNTLVAPIAFAMAKQQLLKTGHRPL